MSDLRWELLKDPRAGGWGPLGFPEKIKGFRPAQVKAIIEIVQRFEAGNQVVVLDAPTGSGKTLVGEAVRRLLGVRGLYVCVDKGLQAQFTGDFDYAATLMGRGNYPTLDYPGRFETEERLSADDCTADEKRRCKWCHDMKLCPYAVAKKTALASQLVCLNTAYFLTEANGPGAFSGWKFVIVDEGDRLEDILLSHAQVSISERMMNDLSVRPLDKDAEIPEAISWIDEKLLPALGRELASLDEDSEDVRTQRRYKRLLNLQNKAINLADGLEAGEWVPTIDRTSVVFKPIRVTKMAESWLWSHSPRFLIMSASMLNAPMQMRDLDKIDGYGIVRMESSFPADNRPVHVRPLANVVRQNEDTASRQLAAGLRTIMKQHATERILVHTVSYALMTRLRDILGGESRAIWYAGSQQRAETLQEYLSRPDSVLFAPALDRGVDLPDDACRVVVICKVPYPNLGDRQIKARFEGPGGREWYVNQALRTLVQMTGRGVRHEKDWCVSYILDAQVERILRQYWSKLPSWWTDAVIDNDEPAPERLE